MKKKHAGTKTTSLVEFLEDVSLFIKKEEATWMVFRKLHESSYTCFSLFLVVLHVH